LFFSPRSRDVLSFPVMVVVADPRFENLL